MGRSQQRHLMEASRRFGREDWPRWYNARLSVATRALMLKKEAGLVSLAVNRSSAQVGSAPVQRYCTSLSYAQNEEAFGRV